MRIAMVGSRGVPALYSGFETAVTEIGRRLVERGHEVIVYCRKGYGDESRPTCLGMRKIYLPRIHLKVADTLSHTLFSLLHLALHPVDVIIVVNPANGPLLAIPRLRGTPVAINVDGLEWERGKWPWLGRRYFYFAAWLSTKLANAVIADSRGIQAFYRERWHCEPFYAPYGGDIEESRRPQVLKEYGLARNRYFVVVARVEPENNTALIIEAFRRLDTTMKLFVVGGTNFRSRYFETLKASNDDPRVTFAGGIYDQGRLTEIICNSFAYVHGHMVGGTNPVLLKAMGCGARVLFADVIFNREVVQDAGLPFTLDIEGASRSFRAVLENPGDSEHLRERARQRVRKAYCWDMVTDRYESLCTTLEKR
jgi:glycosyltransferase involved in cell wall biosynthesis